MWTSNEGVLMGSVRDTSWWRESYTSPVLDTGGRTAPSSPPCSSPAKQPGLTCGLRMFLKVSECVFYQKHRVQCPLQGERGCHGKEEAPIAIDIRSLQQRGEILMESLHHEETVLSGPEPPEHRGKTSTRSLLNRVITNKT